MSEGTGAVEEPPKVPEEPAKRTGAEDPFDPVDPDDPLGVAPEPKPDPFANDDPTQPATRNLGMPIPPPVPPAAPADPPGRTDLRKGVNAVQNRLAALEKAEASGVSRLGESVRAGRNALGEHWQLTVEMILARRGARTSPDDDSGLDGLKDLRATIGVHQEAITAALGDWCAARDSVPPDEAALGVAMARAQDAVDALRGDFSSGSAESLGSETQNDARLIAVLSEAALAQIADEGKVIAAGQRVARGASGEGLSACLLAQTADNNLRNRLEQRATWSDTTNTVESMIGRGTLDTAITVGVGKVDLVPARARLKQLDVRLKARDASPTDYQARSDALQAYLGAIDVYASNLAVVRRGAAEIASGKKGGWSADKAREATDLVSGMLRHLQAELAADPLIEDPDLASAARKAITDIDALTGPSSLDVTADGLGKDLRKAWKTAKASELKALKKAGVDTSMLSKVFDSGLGPALDTWADEVAKFPKHNRATLKNAASDAARTLAQYRAAVEMAAGPDRSSRLVQALDAIAVAMTRQIAAFDQRGGLF